METLCDNFSNLSNHEVKSISLVIKITITMGTHYTHLLIALLTIELAFILGLL